ncbi:MAG: signal peptidase I [Deltaproteobacteria bacterium]|nr:signal peptidase I [Deltaproteobacteria bacterium]
MNIRVRQFFSPLEPRIALLAYIFFGHICIPFRIQGASMEPTYANGGVNFCWTFHYRFAQPKHGDVVAIRLAGGKIMLLKRIVAREGEWVEFRNGKLWVDGKEIDEPYVRYPCRWNLTPRQVAVRCVYVVGDNRDIPMEQHYFGQASIQRIMGVPLW